MRKLIIAITVLSSTTALCDENRGSSGGRFQVVQISNMRRDQFLIDSQTGRLWRSVCYRGSAGADCELEAWEPANVIGISISEKEMYKKAQEYDSFQEMKAGLKAEKERQSAADKSGEK